MRKIGITIFMSIASTFCFGQTEQEAAPDCIVRKNGIYYADLDSATNIYIRFHEGDTAVTTSSIKELKQAAKFVNNKVGKGMLFGKYFTAEGTCSIRIKAKNEFGKVKMDGIVSNDKLVLSVVNIDENTARDFIFRFYPIN